MKWDDDVATIQSNRVGPFLKCEELLQSIGIRRSCMIAQGIRASKTLLLGLGAISCSIGGSDQRGAERGRACAAETQPFASGCVSQPVFDFMSCTKERGINRDVVDRSVESTKGRADVKVKLVDVGVAAKRVVDSIKKDKSTPSEGECRIIEACATLVGTQVSPCNYAVTAPQPPDGNGSVAAPTTAPASMPATPVQAPPTAPSPPEPTWSVASGQVVFDTSNDDKRDDSVVTVEVRGHHGQVIASATSTNEKFPDRTQKKLSLDIRTSDVAPSDVGVGVVHFGHRGNDEWHGDVEFRLVFMKGTSTRTMSCSIRAFVFKESAAERECTMR